MGTLIQGQKFLWRYTPIDDNAVRELAFANNISMPIAHVLYSRGYTDRETVRSFLFSSFDQDVPQASLLKGASHAVSRLIKAIEQKEKILIFGDYDVDGVTSAALLLIALVPLGAQINYYLPIRAKEGYGLSVDVVEKASLNHYSLIITVDNGITAYDAAQKAQELGIDLIITDHHTPQERLPQAHTIIDPHQFDCAYPYKYLAGVGVVFKLVTLLYQYLQKPELPEKVYELLMLGTVADVAPLTGENRFWVRHGLAKINQQQSLALKTLAVNANLTKDTFNSLDIGFMIAPQINALGRLSNPREAVTFLMSSDAFEVARIGNILKIMNEERKKVDKRIYEEIEGAIINKTIDIEQESVIFAANRNWPSGVIGLVAGKLMQNYGRPAFLFHLDSAGVAKGSCRSIPEFNIFQALEACSDLLISYGGHAHAAGLKLTQDNLGALKDRLESLITQQIPIQALAPKITLDAPIALAELTKNLVFDLEQLEPFGNQNPQPAFLIKNVTLIKPPSLLKDRHVKCNIFCDGVIKPVIFFNRPDLFATLTNMGDKSFNLAAYVLKNEWEGTTRIELQGIDIAII